MKIINMLVSLTNAAKYLYLHFSDAAFNSSSHYLTYTLISDYYGLTTLPNRL